MTKVITLLFLLFLLILLGPFSIKSLEARHIIATITMRKELNECYGITCKTDKDCKDLYPDCSCSSSFDLETGNPLAENPECIPDEPESDDCRGKPCIVTSDCVVYSISDCICSSELFTEETDPTASAILCIPMEHPGDHSDFDYDSHTDSGYESRSG